MQQNVKMPTTQDLASMWQASGLKEKLIFTFLMIAAFRFGVQLPIFGINNAIFSNMAAQNNIIGFLDLFSGGALGKVSIFALGIGPYITSSIIIQLLAVVIPSLEKLQKCKYSHFNEQLAFIISYDKNECWEREFDKHKVINISSELTDTSLFFLSERMSL